MIAVISFLFGITIGSFLNVSILRMPKGESVVAPPSHCPKCNRSIAPYDNIPLVSYLILGGRCRHCKTRISPLYFFTELTTGLMFLFLGLRYGLTPLATKHAALGAMLLVLVVADWRERILPDWINLPGIVIGLLFSLVLPVGDGAGLWTLQWLGLESVPAAGASLLDALLGALAGGGLLFLLGEIYYLLRKQEGMGLGDMKMMAMVGCFLGPKLTLFTIFAASVTGAGLGIFFILLFRKSSQYELPFGTFLGAAAFFAAHWGAELVNWYLSLFP